MDYSLNECGVCASESVVAFCENCNFRICKTCFQMHKKSTKLFQNHVAFLIENTQPTEDASVPVDHAREVSKESLDDIHTHKCATHKTENLVFFCTEHTETLCGRCVFSRHKSCKVVDLFEVNVDDEEVHSCKSHLQNLVENLKSNENKIEKNTNENNACKLEFLKDLQQLRTDFIAWCDRLLSKCDKQCNDTFKRNDERLTQVRTFCQEHIKRFQERQELIDNLLTQNHFKKLYVLINRVKKEIEEIKLNLNWPNSASTFNGYVFKRSSGTEELLNSHTFEIGGLEEWCSGSDELLDDTFSSLTNDVRLINTVDKVGASESTILNMLDISPFSYGLSLQRVHDSGSVFESKVIDITDEDIRTRFLQGVRNVASLSLKIGYPTAASAPHSIVNGFKRLLAIAVQTDYTFPAAQRTKDFLKDPSKFVMAAAPVAAAAPAAAKKEEKKVPAKKEESEESEDDMGLGFGLFD